MKYLILVITWIAGCSLALGLNFTSAQTPELLAENIKSPTGAMTIDDQHIYLAGTDPTGSADGFLGRVPVEGGSLEILGWGFARFNRVLRPIKKILLTTDRIVVDYGDYDLNFIESVSYSGGNRTVLATNSGGDLVSFVGNDVFFGRSFNSIWRVNMDAPGDTNQVTSGRYWVRNQTQDGDDTFFNDYFSRSVFRINPSTETTPTVAISRPPDSREGVVRTNSTHLFFGVENSQQMGSGIVISVDKSGGTPSTISLPTSDSTLRAADDDFFYFTIGNASLWRMPVDGGSAEQLVTFATVGDFPGAFEIKDGFLYFYQRQADPTYASLYRLSLVGNEAPTAVAGDDQAIRSIGKLVTLDGSASFDDNTPTQDLTFTWEIVSSPANSNASLSVLDEAVTTFIADAVGAYEIALTVTDESGSVSEPDTVLVSTANLAPTADAGLDQVVAQGQTVFLDGTGSTDPEGDALGYSWSVISSPNGAGGYQLFDPQTSAPSLVPSDLGVYEIQLTVSDQLGVGAPDSVQLVVLSVSDYASGEIADADVVVSELLPNDLDARGHQNSLSNFLNQAAVAIADGDVTLAISKLEQALRRTDGCVLRGSPDSNGSNRDWITDCSEQTELYGHLTSAIDALTAN